MTERPTPGPWKFGHVGTDALWIGPDYNKLPVAHVDHDMEYARENSRANARLIAAAPDLLAAAERALNYITNTEGEMGETLESGDMLRAAIAKARGDVA